MRGLPIYAAETRRWTWRHACTCRGSTRPIAPDAVCLQRQLQGLTAHLNKACGKLRALQSHLEELTFRTGRETLDQLCRLQFGKTILFTDNEGWTDEQIVSAYRSQYHIEDAFKQMKNPHFLVVGGVGETSRGADGELAQKQVAGTASKNFTKH